MLNDPNKWRGGFDDFTQPDGQLVMWDIPNEWMLDLEYRKTRRKDVLKDTLAWAMAADLIEGFPEIDDELLDQMVIPVMLTERGKRLALRAGSGHVAAWAAGLSEGGIQVKLFAKSETPDQFRVMDFNFRRATGDPAEVIFDSEEWEYGVISEWRSSLPDVILDAIQN